MNLRPSGPQPDALPDCATPRGVTSLRTFRPALMRTYVRVSGEEPRRCYRCGEIKQADEFAWRCKARGQRDSFCRPFRSAYGKEHYLANRQRYIDQAAEVKRKLRLERTTFLLGYFATHPCIECGEPDPVVFEFDHLRDKSFDIGQELLHRNWQAILDEIAKCEGVCANCHRRRTARRRGTLRAVLTGE